MKDKWRGRGACVKRNGRLSVHSWIALRSIQATWLLDLARRGNLAAIRERVHPLEQRDTRHAPFAAHVRQLAQAFKLNALEEFFAQWLETSA